MNLPSCRLAQAGAYDLRGKQENSDLHHIPKRMRAASLPARTQGRIASGSKMMIKLTAIAVVTVIAVSVGFSIGSQSAPDSVTQAVGEQRAVFHHPRIDGANLDVRFMAHMQSSVRLVAERFCLNRGYTGVSNLVVRPTTVSRTIADGSWHGNLGKLRQTYSMIECSSQTWTVASAR